jgi:hypothetical protein
MTPDELARVRRRLVAFAEAMFAPLPRASKWRPTAVWTGVSASRCRPSGAKLGVLTKSSSKKTVLVPPYRRVSSTVTLREATSSVSANGGEALC